MEIPAFYGNYKKFLFMALLFLFLLSSPALIRILNLSEYLIHILVLANIYALYAAAWDTISGYTGQVSLGHALFLGMGGYIGAFLAQNNVPIFLCPLLAGVIVGALSLIVGVPCLRLSGPYLAIATLAFMLSVRSIILAFYDVTGAEMGYPAIPLVYGSIANYYVSFTVMVVLVSMIHLVVNYRLRLPFLAIRESEAIAKSIGLNVTKYRLLAFTLSAAFSGVAGCLLACYTMRATPEMLYIPTSFMPIASSIVGGIGTIIGPVFGAYILTIISEMLRTVIYKIRLLIYGVTILIFMLLMPDGIYGFVKKVSKKFKGFRISY
ncbi:MAG: branched-chain amino acid ABC transporter permease [Candidatus Bathyarchaeia archaeon]